MNDLQSRIAELMEELGQQGPALASAQQELTRLQAVEVDLARTVATLCAEIGALKTAQMTELNAVAAAGATLRAERDAVVAAREAMQVERDEVVAARDAIRADRDDHIDKYKNLDKHHYKETTRLRRKAKGYCDAMKEMDTLVSGKSLPPPTA